MERRVHRLIKKRGRITNYAFSLTICTLLSLFIPIDWVQAQAVPELTSISPRGAQRGTTIEIALQGKSIRKATALLFSGDGISGEINEIKRQATAVFNGSGVSGNIPNDNRLVAQVTIALDAPLGGQDLRLVTPKGISNAQRFIVEDTQQMAEEEPNSTLDTANMIHLPITISGKIESVDDTDFFRFVAKKRQRLICDVNASRMGSSLDSFLTLFGPDGEKVASNDIANGLDSLIDYTIPEDAEGEYTLQIRDLRYKGGEQFVYRLRIGELPYLDSIFPLGGRQGMESTISVEGRNLAEVKSMQVSIAPDAPLGVQKVRVTTPSGLSTNPHLFVVGDLPETTETEPNNMRDKANAVVPPLTINGKIDLEGDVDYFTFKAQKEQRLIFEVNSRRLGSMLDSFLTLFDAKGEELMVNDDTTDLEAQIDFTFQDDGDYSIAIRDLNNEGGSDFAYRLSIRPLQPDFRIAVTPDNPRVGRGGNTVLTVTVSRIDGFNGPLRFSFPNLPKDFSVSPAILAPNQTQDLITLTAPANAPLGYLPITVTGIGAIQGKRVERTAQPNPIYLTVMKTPKFLLEIIQVNGTVIQSKSMDLNIKAIRNDGIVAPIALSVIGLPPRVTASKSTIPENQSEATITINAGSFVGRELIPVLSPVLTQDIVVNGTATINNESITQSTAAFSLTITETPFVIAVEPVRLSLVLPISSAERNETLAANGGTNENNGEPAETESVSEERTAEAILTIKATRQGGFTDKIDIILTGLPEKGLRISEENVSIPDHETEAKVTLTADANLKPDTYTFRFIGVATINDRKFDVESPTVTVKIIGSAPVASSESP